MICPSHSAQRSPRSPKEWNATQSLPSSPARECRSAHYLNFCGLSHFCFSDKCSLSQLNCPFSSIPKYVNGAHANNFALCLNFNVLNETIQ